MLESPLALARSYLACVFNEPEFSRLYQLCHAEMVFNGPSYQFNDARSYIEALEAAGANAAEMRELHAYEDEKSACIVYEYSRGSQHACMCQIFETENGKITAIRLIFDTGPFIQQ